MFIDSMYPSALYPLRFASFRRSAAARAVASISMLLASSAAMSAEQLKETTESPPTTAESTAQEQHLSPVEVRSTALENRTYTREEMDATAKGNRDITSLIAEHPAVRLNPNMDGSGNRGSLAPEQFSIHGASPFQNQFMIDGIGATNMISPHNDNLNLQIGNVPGFSQAYNIDTDLLDNVEVHDSRVPVEFGHFTGGVVDARIKAPTGTNQFSIKRSFNSSNLTQQAMPESKHEAWINGEPGMSGVWKKHFTSLNGDLRVNDQTTALLSFSRRQSDISRLLRVLDRPNGGTPNGNTVRLTPENKSDTVDNLMGKIHTHWGGGLRTNVLLKHADRQEDLVHSFFPDTAWTNRQKATGVAVEVEQTLASGELTAKIGWDQMDALRESSDTQLVTQQFWNGSGLSQYTAGGFGTEALKQRQLSAKLRMDWNAFDAWGLHHKVYVGADIQGTDAKFDRMHDSYSYRAVMQQDGTQKIYSKTHNMAGTASAAYNALGLYVSDSMQWQRWTFNVGMRVDRDDLFKNTNFAPRARLDWDLQGNGQTQLGMGFSRYYGLDLMGYALARDKSRLSRTLINAQGVEVNNPTSPVIHNFDGVKTEYSDEWTFSVTQQLTSSFEGSLSYVRRTNRDGVTKEGTSSSGYFYANKGKGNNETVMLSLRTVRPWQALAAQWSGRLDFSWQDSKRNRDTTLGYDTDIEAPDDIVEYNGQAMQRKNMPASIFNQPRRLSLSTQTHWQTAGVEWGNRLSWRSSRPAINYLGMRNNMERYASVRLPSYWTWDTTITWKPQQVHGLVLSVEVLNLLNRMPRIAAANPQLANNVRYQTGREIWLTAGYQF